MENADKFVNSWQESQEIKKLGILNNEKKPHKNSKTMTVTNMKAKVKLFLSILFPKYSIYVILKNKHTITFFVR